MTSSVIKCAVFWQSFQTSVCIIASGDPNHKWFDFIWLVQVYIFELRFDIDPANLFVSLSVFFETEERSGHTQLWLQQLQGRPKPNVNMAANVTARTKPTLTCTIIQITMTQIQRWVRDYNKVEKEEKERLCKVYGYQGFRSLLTAFTGKNLKQSWLPAFWKKDPKHTRD